MVPSMMSRVSPLQLASPPGLNPLVRGVPTEPGTGIVAVPPVGLVEVGGVATVIVVAAGGVSVPQPELLNSGDPYPTPLPEELTNAARSSYSPPTLVYTSSR